MENQKLTPKGKIITGYKATNKDMTCNPNGNIFQFELGKWYEIEGELKLCENGFHFCEFPSGPWSFYNNKGTRIFKIEAEEVLLSEEPGAARKHVARKIRLVEEIIFAGYSNAGARNTGDYNTGSSNTGDRNVGYSNTGYSNTGDRNVGNYNTGYSNTGNRNTGYSNTGNRNTGDFNAGDSNTGYSNTGYSNTGDRNTGSRNTGNHNTGNRNTGRGNAGNRHTGLFSCGSPPFYIFDLPANEKDVDYTLVNDLCYYLEKDEDFDVTPFLSLPNATVERIKTLHQKHIEARKKYLV